MDVPVVCLLTEGGLSALEQVSNSVQQGLPAVVCANSGRAADVLAWAIDEYHRIQYTAAAVIVEFYIGNNFQTHSK